MAPQSVSSLKVAPEKNSRISGEVRTVILKWNRNIKEFWKIIVVISGFSHEEHKSRLKT